MSAEDFSNALMEQIGPDKAYPSQLQAAKAIGVSKSLFSIMVMGKRDEKGRLLFSRKSAEQVAEAMGISKELIPHELRPISLREQARKFASPTRVAFGERIKRERDRLGITDCELARGAGLLYSQVANANSGVSCTPNTAIKLCDYLGISYAEIPDEISQLRHLSIVHVTLLAALGITTEKQLADALKESLVNATYRRDAKKYRGEAEATALLLAAARRQISELRNENTQLRSKIESVSADKPPG